MALTLAGREWVVDKMQDLAPNANGRMRFIGWGTGSTGVGTDAAGDTALVTPASEARVDAEAQAAPNGRFQPTATTDRMIGTLTADGTKTINEVGRFNQLTTGVMIQRHTFTGIPLLAGDAIQFTLDVTT